MEAILFVSGICESSRGVQSFLPNFLVTIKLEFLSIYYCCQQMSTTATNKGILRPKAHSSVKYLFQSMHVEVIKNNDRENDCVNMHVILGSVWLCLCARSNLSACKLKGIITMRVTEIGNRFIFTTKNGCNRPLKASKWHTSLNTTIATRWRRNNKNE